MRATIIALAFIVSAAAFAKAPNQCAGLAEAACNANPECMWVPAVKAGDANPETGKVYKVTQKANCRKTKLPGNRIAR